MSTTEKTRERKAGKKTSKSSVQRDDQPSASMLSRAGGGVLNAILRRLDVSSVSLEKLSAEDINVGRIELDNASVANVELSDMKASVSTDSARLFNVRSVVSLNLSIDWRVRVPLFPDPSGTIGPLGIPVPFKLGNVDIADIDTINIEVPSASVTGAQVSIQPLTNLGFDGGEAENINLSTLQMPSNGFAMSGLSYDSFDLNHLGMPDGNIASANIGELSPNGALQIPQTEIRDVQIPAVDVPTVNSVSPINVENAESDIIPPIPFDLGILVLTIRLTPTMDLNIERLELSDMQASSSIDRISLNDMSTSVKVSDVSISGIAMEQLSINQVSV